MGNGFRDLALKIQQNTQVALSLNALGINRQGSLELWYCQVRPLLAQIFLRFLDVGRQARLLLVCGLAEAQCSRQKQHEDEEETSEKGGHQVQIIWLWRAID